MQTNALARRKMSQVLDGPYRAVHSWHSLRTECQSIEYAQSTQQVLQVLAVLLIPCILLRDLMLKVSSVMFQTTDVF